MRAVEGDAAKVETPPISGTDTRVAGCIKSMDWRSQALGRGVLGKPGKEHTVKILPACERYEDSYPSIARGGDSGDSAHLVGIGHVNGPVIIGCGKDMQRIPPGDGARRFVLALHPGISQGKLGPGDHVDIAAGDWHILSRCGARGSRPRRNPGQGQEHKNHRDINCERADRHVVLLNGFFSGGRRYGQLK